MCVYLPTYSSVPALLKVSSVTISHISNCVSGENLATFLPYVGLMTNSGINKRRSYCTTLDSVIESSLFDTG